ncbi:MAG: DUF4163 domain-containing protein [Oscillospiraceae bacterium]|nr:DUF4163 domain-containing protein [Oscillospiraceae bacterium]
MKKVFIPVIVAAVMLAGCEKNPAEVTEQVSEAEVTFVETVTTSVTSETVIFCDEEVFKETSAEVSDTAEKERSEFIKKAEENPAVNVDIIIDELDIYDLSENLVGYFYAEYPNISGTDEKVCEKINKQIKTFIDNRLCEEQNYLYDLFVNEDGSANDTFLFLINDFGRKEIRSIGCEINCNYGNLLSIYFRAFTYNIVVPIQFSEPYTMVFDLRTGEQVDFDKIIADREGFDSVFEKAFAEYGSYMEYNGESYFMNTEGDYEYDYMLFDKITVKNDCLGMYLVTPSMFDLKRVEICEVCVPISDIEQYLTIEGRELFEGFFDKTEYKVTPANELYNVYPKRITYPEKTKTNITAEKAEIKEEFKKDGYTVDEFRAVYPVFSGGDKAVMQKINDSVKAYIDEVYEKSKKHTEEYDIENDTYVKAHFGFSMSICGNSRNNTELTYDINGNILSVDFYTEDYAGGAHGAVRPVSLVFDLRTGEKVDFNNIFEDKNAVVNEINMAAYQYFERIWSRHGVDEYESGFENLSGKLNTDDLDRGHITVKNGCLSYCTVPYEFGGSFADGMQFMDVAMEDIYPYLNEAGKSLFEGYASAKSEPVNIIEEYGEKYFDLD